jgi:hypothetical protein
MVMGIWTEITRFFNKISKWNKKKLKKTASAGEKKGLRVLFFKIL